MAKRLFDLLGAGLALLLLAPLLLVVAAVRWDSVGPVFFRQERVGRQGGPFRIHKFRTMRADAPALGPQVTLAHDVCITRLSLVGPRPRCRVSSRTTRPT
jgi:lipopolysaccharide/colanic/teichoic acid biosynthesis glycosyltransferase